MHNHGWFLCQQQRYAEADALFERALAQPQYRDVGAHAAGAGRVPGARRPLAEAEQTLSRAYELDPANPVTALQPGRSAVRSAANSSARASTSAASTQRAS